MIKKIITISGIAGALLLVIRLLGLFITLPYKDIFLIAGLVLLFVVCLPLVMVEKNTPYRSKQSVNQSSSSPDHKNEDSKTDDKDTYTGWGMNDSPFRSRKSGLSWGGGNIKASNAQRETRRRFLKK
ncbi:hypothetical protein ACE1ET_08055 [Saccharicrinis sp. FJH62]|uniref:hypothetical protein n=1 Tax=Saccharicrinis sp. FJH62 TaxID=3344657 RepID=UPI0035D4C479